MMTAIRTTVIHQHRHNLDISYIEYCILDGISVLSQRGKEWCRSSAQYFADTYFYHVNTVKTALDRLIKIGFIEKRGGRRNTERRLTKKGINEFLKPLYNWYKNCTNEKVDEKPIGTKTVNHWYKKCTNIGTENVPHNNSNSNNNSTPIREYTLSREDETKIDPPKDEAQTTSVNAEKEKCTPQVPPRPPKLSKVKPPPTADQLQAIMAQVEANSSPPSKHDWQLEMSSYLKSDNALKAERANEGWTIDLVRAFGKYLQRLHDMSTERTGYPLNKEGAKLVALEISEWLSANSYPIQHIINQLEDCWATGYPPHVFRRRVKQQKPQSNGQQDTTSKVSAVFDAIQRTNLPAPKDQGRPPMLDY